MASGYNTNVQIRDRVYHVQTEVIRGSQFIIASHIYSGGTIIHSQKTSFVHLVGTPDEEKKLSYLVENQHRKLLTSLRHGPHPPASFVSPPSPPTNPIKPDSVPDDTSGAAGDDTSADEDKDTSIMDTTPTVDVNTLRLRRELDDRMGEPFPDPGVLPPTMTESERQRANEESGIELGPIGGVSSSDIKQSAFLQKIKIQTDKMKALRISRPEPVSSALHTRINAILEEANSMIQGIRLSGVVIGGALTALEIHETKQDGPTYTELIARSMPMIEQFLEALASIGELEENILTFQNNRLFLYCLGKKQFFLVLVDRARPVELVRNACLPCIRRLQEALRFSRN